MKSSNFLGGSRSEDVQNHPLLAGKLGLDTEKLVVVSIEQPCILFGLHRMGLTSSKTWTHESLSRSKSLISTKTAKRDPLFCRNLAPKFHKKPFKFHHGKFSSFYRSLPVKKQKTHTKNTQKTNRTNFDPKNSPPKNCQHFFSPIPPLFRASLGFQHPNFEPSIPFRWGWVGWLGWALPPWLGWLGDDGYGDGWGGGEPGTWNICREIIFRGFF